MNGASLIDEIREANLNVYRASPARLREDVGSESEIAHDYQGRLIYELLQNADDAMGGQVLGYRDTIRFRLTDNELLVMNSGRALTEADVRGLTATGASSKTGSAKGGGRASIGHKGMGFKSILEITNRPEVFSTTYSFVLDGDRALPDVREVFTDLGHPAPDRIPTMRFPWNTAETSEIWPTARAEGFNVLFRFPFRNGLDQDKVANLARSLLTLPATTILFLKHLEVVQIEVETSAVSGRISWSIGRERSASADWEPVEGLTGSGVYRVRIKSDDAKDIWCFLLGHEDGLAIGNHRGGLNAYAWAGIGLTEVTVAALVAGGDDDELPVDWRRFHVFLPTDEPSPYPLLINGAFATDLSRKEIHVLPEAEDYNRFLIDSAAKVLRDRLLPAVQKQAGGIDAVLRLLARDPGQVGTSVRQTAAVELHRAVVAALGTQPLIPTGPTSTAAIDGVAVAQTFGHPTLGVELRELLSESTSAHGKQLPVAHLCAEPFASILVDHGALPLTGPQTVGLLEGAPPERTHLTAHQTGKLSVDPVLRILQTLWENADKEARGELEHAVRAAQLFPVAKASDGTVDRIRVGDTETFFPPRALSGAIPLPRLRFMLQDLCWGTLTPRERTDVLRSQMPAWTALFQIREFKFPDVMRVSVLPALALDVGIERRQTLANWDTLTAVCQLAGPTPSPDTPLPYGRLGSQRALFNLCRLPVPCLVNGQEEWIPAYQAYFGTAWIGDASVEPLIGAAADFKPTANVRLPIVVDPAQFIKHLEQLRGLKALGEKEEDGDADGDDEVDVDEDDELATEADSLERWLSFLTWLGVNRVLRPVSFQDAEDKAKGWISTRGLSKPAGWAFHRLGPIWDDYTKALRTQVAPNDQANHDLYFYRLHDLEDLDTLCTLAGEDDSCGVATALFSHLARNWGSLERFTDVELALLTRGTQPGRRADPPRADAKELKRFGDNLWLFRLRRASICPTAHGPRQPGQTWWRSSEVERRFNRRGSSADQYLPVLADAASTPVHEARRFGQTVGVRVELTPAVFTLADAAAFVRRVDELFAGKAADKPAEVLRNQINPAYQNLFELLSGRATAKDNAKHDLASLRQSRLLVHDGRGHYRFDLAHNVLYAARGGPREIHGIAGELWTFVLEGRPAVAAPLRSLFGARNLEDVLQWHLEPDENPLDGRQTEQFRTGLRDIAPYLLARLMVERAEEERAGRDATGLRNFIENVVPTKSLSATCTLDGEVLLTGGQRQSFVRRSGRETVAFVRWGENPWPPDPAEAEALATAITELLGVGYFEPLLALLLADTLGRERLLHLAGGSGNLDAAREALRPEPVPPGPGPGPVVLPKPTPGPEPYPVVQNPPDPPGPAPVTRVHLVNLESLRLDGDPIIESGQPHSPKASRVEQKAVANPGGGAAPSAYGGGTDLEELNRIGMRIAMMFEQRRLAKNGIVSTIFDPENPQPGDAVFDVSTPVAISYALDSSERFRKAVEVLRAHGVAADVPGFDILTLDVNEPDNLGRLIELKSSGVSARTQQMTWNEWKTAGKTRLQSRFYLYLVGNLRADLEAAPFIRAIKDPFGELIATESTSQGVRRTVNLEIRTFREAEFQKLTVLRNPATDKLAINANE